MLEAFNIILRRLQCIRASDFGEEIIARFCYAFPVRHCALLFEQHEYNRKKHVKDILTFRTSFRHLLCFSELRVIRVRSQHHRSTPLNETLCRKKSLAV